MAYKKTAAKFGCLAFLAGGALAAQPAFASKVTPFIVGGTRATGSEPWVKNVASVMDGSQGGICGGAIVRESWVLTAAHCVENAPIEKLYIFFGTDAYGINSPVGKPVQVLVHPQRRAGAPADAYDLALVRLRNPVPARTNAPAVLASAPLAQGQQILFTGYGLTRPDEETPDGTLRYASASVGEANFSATEIRVNQANGAGSCLGDSGSPVFVSAPGGYALAAVVSRGDARCRVSVATKVAPFLGWIRSVAGAP